MSISTYGRFPELRSTKPQLITARVYAIETSHQLVHVVRHTGLGITHAA